MLTSKVFTRVRLKKRGIICSRNLRIHSLLCHHKKMVMTHLVAFNCLLYWHRQNEGIRTTPPWPVYVCQYNQHIGLARLVEDSALWSCRKCSLSLFLPSGLSRASMHVSHEPNCRSLEQQPKHLLSMHLPLLFQCSLRWVGEVCRRQDFSCDQGGGFSTCSLTSRQGISRGFEVQPKQSWQPSYQNQPKSGPLQVMDMRKNEPQRKALDKSLGLESEVLCAFEREAKISLGGIVDRLPKSFEGVLPKG